MNDRTNDPSAEVDAAAAEAGGRGWPAAVVIGLLLGAIASIVAALLRQQPVVKEQLAPGPGKPAGALPGSPPNGRPAAGPAAVKAPAGGGQPGPGIASAESGPPPPAPSSRWREASKYVVGVFLFLAVLVVAWISRSVIPTVIVAALLAMIVEPVISFFQRRLKLAKGLSVALTYLLILSLIFLIPLVVVPSLIQTINDVGNIDFEALAETVTSALQALSAQVAQIPVLNTLLTPFLDSLSVVLQGIPAPDSTAPVTYEAAMGTIVNDLAGTLGTIASILGPIVSAVVTLVFMLLISLHLSLSGQRIMESYPRLIPPAYVQEVTGLVARIEEVWLSFLRGQFTLMVIVGVIVWLGNAVLGNRNALMLGFISGLMEVIPNLGPALALIPGVGMALLFGSSHFALPPLAFGLIVLAFYLLVQVLENQLIVPYVLGGQLEVPPLVVLIGIMVGGTVAGILGVLLAVPVIATGREIFAYLYDKILEAPEPEEPPEKKPSLLDTVRNRLREVKLPIDRLPKLPFGRREEAQPAPEAKGESAPA